MTSRLIGRSLLALLALTLSTARGASEELSFRYRTARTKQSLAVTRHRHVTVNFGQGRVGIFCGFGKATAEVFDVASETFRKLAFQQHFGDFNGIALPDGKALLVDGQHDGLFDPATEQLTGIAPGFTGKFVRWPAMLTLPDGRIFLAGGSDADFKPVDDCVIFDPQKRQFEPVGKLHLPRAHHSANLIDDHRVLIAGGTGANYTTESFDSLEIFDLQTRTSTPVPVKLGQPRANHAAVRLPDSQVLIVGGYCAQCREGSLKSAEIFDPTTGQLTEVGSLAIGRSEPQAARLPSGRVAVFGGRDDVRVVEIYDPTTKKFTAADQLLMDPRRSGFTVTALDDGGLLIVGGRVNSTAEELSGAEIFREMKLPAPPPPRADLDELIRQLGHDNWAKREAATRQLIERGSDVIGAIKPLLTHRDPEVRHRAATILKKVRGGHGRHWCVDIWRGDQRVETCWLDDDAPPGHRDETDVRLVTLKKALAAHPDAHLVVRFPEDVPAERQTELLNLVGWLRTPIVYRGEPL